MKSNAILVTGATSGIGLELARKLASEGYHVVITGRNKVKLDDVETKLGANITTLLCDNENHHDVQAIGKEIQALNIKLDGVVFNAGVYFPNELGTTSLEEFELTLNTNFKAPFFMLQSLLPVMNNPASVVMVSSLVVEKAFVNSSLYTSSKMALEGLVGVLNLELAERGIRINSVRPGVTATDIQEKAGMSQEAFNGLKLAMKETPAGRILTPKDIVPAIEFLLSESSIGLRGAAFDIDGGLSL
ncbi:MULTISPECIES: SDR family NAD(P)-dependent oxidoreductase [unclassified Vibrio]|uniref:SDR family NAD(P)-dependent oxidoreductase n=1 Tax=unclassified Vibrio TaxID=2614977 RepID=UPI002554B4AE|nr:MULTISPECIES: SDR family oxidoreductase [unclassified Vibrio]MDK9776651.1 SDR family oxidoreductase [Vibrio sp. D401a]MDK9806131.1 SDR family oxidoreductase [Vibrio sp. D406a]